MAEGLSIHLHQDGPIALAVDFEVTAGETLALVGPSGAGKTTVLKAIAGLYQPAKGCIVCDGKVWLDRDLGTHVPAQARRVGLVFQSYALFPHKTALGNIAEAMLEYPRAEREARATALLERVHLEGLGARFPAELSGGQQQRVALARALARDPHVLLLDEPFSAVDQPTRRALHALLAEIRASSAMPIIFVSHDIEDAAHSADRICFLQNGVSVEQGATRAILDDPGSALARWLNG
ncbi:MAG: ABC transporter [Novosphingobium sp. 28-62-57]|uniref:sulfate/molybdate ABC transporter ATP-binding protein n=1 Tax=unclassified Novosphingobium TaxID=2644732 RepID=UPI000BD8CDDD|nr:MULTISPECIES: ATP-binding cassette domain-containing protein [unclassified Novosphingobium]OYW49937.1 MAG: ABC transporter [Novosphingobium sp. 12-62-10]OYZ12091.1 MAG: ABC transporter [Novosphingobium sp. 28-62-57]OZA39204.1 MAG: ABC transporter [Novosphingobium sp. 17-62-9]HQS68674.1 ATP-binding cassette domain-containing protein [Novosphingobium sp.]